MTSQGVNFNEFRFQLASVHGEYDLLKNQWEREKSPLGCGSFGLAIVDWDQALLFWKRDLNSPAWTNHISVDPALLAFYESNDPKGRALVTDSGQAALNLSLAARVFMADASDLCDKSKSSVEGSH
jgi:hypothetical protein